MKKTPARTTVVVKSQLGATEYELRRQGKSWNEVAKAVGHGDPARAYAEHERFMQRAVLDIEAAERRRALALELDRLDFLQSQHWPAATVEKNLDAAKFVLSVIQARIKLLRLDDPNSDGTGTMRTVVIAGDHQQYVAAMKQLLADQEAIDAELVDEDE